MEQQTNQPLEASLEPKKPLIPENVSKRITALRYLLIVLVVIAHNNKTYLFIQDREAFKLLSWETFVHLPQILNYTFFGQAAVPLFFMFSAYLLAKKNDPYLVMLKKKAKGLLTPFFLWPAITIAFFIAIKAAAILIFPDKVNHTLPYVSEWSLEDWICAFIGKYPRHYNNSLFEPYIGPFYYVRDLFIFCAISPLIRLGIKKCRLAYWLLALLLYTRAPAILFGWSGFIYFSLGYFCGMYDVDFFEFADKAPWKALIPICAFAIILTVYYTGTTSALLVLMGSIFMLKFSKIIAEKWYEAAKYLSEFSFFLFAIHEPKLLNKAADLWYHFIPQRNAFSDQAEFFIVGFGICALGTLIGIALKKFLPKVFYPLNGGR